MSTFGFNPQNRPMPQQPLVTPYTGVQRPAPSGQAPLTNGLNSTLQQGLLAGKMLFEQLSLLDSAMTSVQLQQMLKQVLRLPPDIQSLLALLADPESANAPQANQATPADMAGLQNLSKVPLTALQSLLENRLAQANTRLIELMQGNPTGHSMDGQKLGELMQVSSQMLATMGKSPVGALQVTFLLYLPWNPMPTPERLAVSFQAEDDEEPGSPSDDPALVLLLQTKALGRFKLLVSQADGTRLVAELEHDPLPDSVLRKIEAGFTQKLLAQGFPPPNLTFIEREAGPGQAQIATNASPETSEQTRVTTTAALSDSPAPQATTPTTPCQNIAVYPTQGVSLFVVMGGYQLARLIFEQDDQTQLIQTREKQVL
jgi:hypothetical protein